MAKSFAKFISFFFFIFLLLFQHVVAQTKALTPDQALARSIFKELIEIPTVHSTGNTTIACEAMAKRLIDAGYAEKDIQIVGPEVEESKPGCSFAWFRQTSPTADAESSRCGRSPPRDWSMDPFKLTEQDGWFYGRGTLDIKDGSAILVANFIRMKKEGYVPDRDLILALTAEEEGRGEYNGVEWLVKNQRALIDAEYCINMDAGDPQEKNGKADQSHGATR